MITGLVKFLSGIALLYVCYGALLFFAQRLVIYPGRSLRAPDSSHGPSPEAIPLWLRADGGRVEAWFLPGRRKASGKIPVVIFFHGNDELIDFLPEQVEGFRAIGMGVLLVEYPGYGRSSGKPCEKSLTAVAVAAYDALLERADVDPGRIVAYGRSLGSGPACALSKRRPLVAIILQSPFTSIRPFARRFFLPGFLVRDVFDNRAALAAFTGPVLIMHGKFDDVVPFSEGETLARFASHAEFREFACSHNDFPPDKAEYWRIIGRFMKAHGIVG
jgi:fermentation-respiration switch protein FrsA (DUF1100 family)